MQLGRHAVSTLRPPPISSITLSPSVTPGCAGQFAVATDGGYEVYSLYPMALLRRRALPGTLERAVIVAGTPLLVLQGGGNNPVYPPNKAMIYHDALGIAVAEIEFGERIRGVVVRRGMIVIALLRRVKAFTYGMNFPAPNTGGKDSKGKGKVEEEGFWLKKVGEWETAENPHGLCAISTIPDSTLLALPGRQAGHVQLIALPPCPRPATQVPAAPAEPHKPTAFRSPIILAHEHALASLSCSADGAYIISTSERGTLLRVWDVARGNQVQELRRGVDRAVMWGAAFQPPTNATSSAPGAGGPSSTGTSASAPARRGGAGDIVGWSDKGTIHIWPSITALPPTSSQTSAASITGMLSRNLPLPKYFSSTASFAQYRLPRKNPHVLANVVNAASVKVGVGEKREEETEEAEHFVVCWVEVPVASEGDPKRQMKATAKGAGHAKHTSHGGPGAHAMGSREERRSFGSDATSRTATPTTRARPSPSGFSERSQTPTMSGRQSSLSSVDTSRTARTAMTTPAQGSPAAGSNTTADQAVDEAKTEWQLIAITYSGDWYRLRVPPAVASGGEDEGGKGGGKCELVEYRRVHVGGRGW